MNKINLSTTRPRDCATGPGKLALHNLTVKYKSYGYPPGDHKSRPSELVREKLDLPIPYRDGRVRLKPRIIERHNFFNLPYQIPSTVPEDEPLFQPFPPQITFTGYKAFQKYHTILQLRNNDKVVRRVMVIPMVSEVLTVQPYSYPDTEKQTIYDELGTSRVACGMEFSVIVNWCPQDEDDFESEVIVVTEREKFVVPVICHGLRGVLDLQDEIHFPPTPVHFNYKKNVMLKNPGTKAANFQLKSYIENESGAHLEETFFVEPTRGKIEAGQFLEFCLEFKSTKIGSHEGELEVFYEDTSEYVYSRLCASGYELDVGLSTDSLTMKSTHICTTSEQSVFFTNYSTEVVVFQLERYATHHEEVRLQLLGMPVSAFDWAKQAANMDCLDENEDEDAPPEEKIFTINPSSGELWPGSRLEVKITFSPQRARRYFTIAYCTISGKQNKLQLRIDGLGVGPLAQFFPTRVDLKELSLYSEYNFDVNLHNTGELNATFELESDRSKGTGTIFKFNPKTGNASVGEVQKIRVTLFCNERVKFQEEFKWFIKDSVNFAPLHFRGAIGNPSVVVEPLSINFGLISFGFDCFRELNITNNSNVPLHFKLQLDELEVYMTCPVHGPMKRIKVPYDCDPHGPESYFTITPNLPTVSAKETLTIIVKCTPLEQREYEGFISLHLDEIDQIICKVNFEAKCQIPKVTLPMNLLNYDRTYLRFEYTQPLELLNESQVPAKYKLLPLDYEALQKGDVFSRPREGIIDAFSLLVVDVTFLAYVLGTIEFSLLISIYGKDPLYLSIKIKAYGIGAELKFVVHLDSVVRSTGDPPVLDFGKVKVLEDHCAIIEITNVSLIPAIFQIAHENMKNSAFRISLNEATLLPQGRLNLKVTTCVDDTLKFKDTLHVTLEGNHYKILCFVKGYGSLLLCKEFDLGAIHFGDVLTYAFMSFTLNVQNMGQRTRQVTWTTLDAKVNKTVFSISPMKLELPSKATTSFVLSGSSNVVAALEEIIVCTGTLPPSSTKKKDEPEIHNIRVGANVEHLALVITPNSLKFVQMNGPRHEELEETLHTITCQNVFKLELHGTLVVSQPFRLSRSEFCLQPQETMKVDAILDWQRPEDKLSHTFSSAIEVNYRDTLRKDCLPLVAEIHFPNLHIEANKIDFGCVIENTSKRVQLKILNNSILEAQYSWAFIDKHGTDIITTGACIQENDGYKIPTNQIFDILPIRGALYPGESEKVEFSYLSFPNYKCRALALCEVEGGPSYSVILDAESSAIKYTLNRHVLDFGVQHFIRPLTSKALSLKNESGVPFNYNINLDDIKRKFTVQIDPTTGSIASGGKKKFQLTILPGIPDKFVEHFKLQVEYFYPHDLEVRMEGLYPSVTLDTGRVRSHKFLSLVEEAWANIHDSKVKGLLYPMKDSPTDSEVTSNATIEVDKLTNLDMPATTTLTTNEYLRIQRHPSTCVTPSIFYCGHTNDNLAREIESSQIGSEIGVLTTQDDGIIVKTTEQIAQEKVDKEIEEAKRIEENLKPTIEEVDAEIDRILVLKHFYEAAPIVKKDRQLVNIEEKDQESIEKEEGKSPPKKDPFVPVANATLTTKEKIGIATTKIQGGKITKSPLLGTKEDTIKANDIKEATIQEKDCPPLIEMQEKYNVDIQKIVANQYFLDFENVRLGFAKKLIMRVNNCGYLPVTFKVDKSKAKGFGFSIEPDRVVKLPSGHIVPQTTELFVTFNTSAPNFPVGNLECWVPINIKEGPMTMLLLRANVIAPDLQLSNNSLDFGIVSIGKCKSMYIKFKNKGEAPCEWHVERPEPGTVTMRILKDWDFFSCTPDFGTIPPHDFMIVKVVFTPKLQNLKSNYETIISIKVSSVQTPYIVTLKGRGYLVPLCFVPSFVEVGPIIPNSKAPAQVQVQFKNRSNQTIEVYSVDFDSQYIQEEKILKEVKTYNDKNIIYVNPREAGEPFWDGLVEDKSTSPKGPEIIKGTKPSKEETTQLKRGNDKTKDGHEKDKQEDISMSNMISGPIIMIYGPPLIGKTTQATMISKNLKIPIIDMQVVMSLAVEEKKLVFPQKENYNDLEVVENKGENKKSGDPQSGIQIPKEKQKPSKKGEKIVKGRKEPTQKRDFEVDLMNVLRTRLQNLDCAKGVVFDGLRSIDVPVNILIKCVLQVLGLKSSVVNVRIPQDKQNTIEIESLPTETKEVPKTKKVSEDKGRTEPKEVGNGGEKATSNKTIPRNIWTGGPKVNFFLLRASSQELSSYYEKLSEACHSILKSKHINDEDEEDVVPTPRLCQHHLHFPSLEDGGPYRTELACHIHLDTPSQYPYTSIFPTPEEIEKFFAFEEELMKILGDPTPLEEVETLGQCVILSPIAALQEMMQVLEEEMAFLPIQASNMPLPEPVELQVIRKPQLRDLVDLDEFPFAIMTTLPEFTLGSPQGDDKEKVEIKENTEKKNIGAKGKGSKKEVSSDKKIVQKNPLSIVPIGHEKKTRWIIPPKASINLSILFWSAQPGEFDHAFHFELMGSLGHHATLDCTGISNYPQITLFYMRFPPRRLNPNLIGVKDKRNPILIPILEAELDFGPTNTGIQPNEYPNIPDGSHCKKLCVKNSGLFDLHVDFEITMIIEDLIPSLPSELEVKKGREKPISKNIPRGEKDDNKKGAKVVKKKGKKEDGKQAVFSLHPKELDLQIDQSSILSLFCYPKEGLSGRISAKLLCKIKENPEPMEFLVTCVSDTPRVELNSNEIDFQRVLLGKQRVEELSIRNICGLKVKWTIVDLEKLPPNFSLSKTSGVLKAGAHAMVSLAFRPTSQEKFDVKLKLQVTHGKENLVVAQEHHIKLISEGYVMDVIITFPNPEVLDGIDFGTIKVAEDSRSLILMENKGKYPIKYKFNLTGKLIQDLFTVSTFEGTIAPKGKTKVELHFNKAKTLQKETTLERNPDITIDLIEPLYDRMERRIPIYVSLHAVHTRFLILPAREIDFEYQVCGLLSEPRTMKILNTGVFDLEFKLLSPLETGSQSPKKEDNTMTKKGANSVVSAKTNTTLKTQASAKGGKGKKGEVATKGNPKMLDLRGFQLFPATGKVSPGSKQDVAIYFKAPETPLKVFQEISIDIKGRDPMKYPKDISYDLKGESQFPGFIADPEVIFEEHRIVDHFDTILPSRTYSKADQTYSFGPIFVDTTPSLISTIDSKPGKPYVKFSLENDLLKSKGKSTWKGEDVNFKIDNPYKVPCTVEFTLTPEMIAHETLEAYEVPFAMEIQPLVIDIPPLECRYIQCLFTPKCIRAYAAIFEAIIKNGGDDVRTRQFKCHLKGEGTLPHIEVESPIDVSPSGALWLKYPRTKINQSITLPIILSNSGIVTATVNILVGEGCDRWIQMSLQKNHILYSSLSFNSSFKVCSKQSETILVTLTPLELMQYECEIQISVNSNPFNNINILLSGEGYMEDVECIGLPRQLNEKIWFEDGPYGMKRSVSFILKNNCNKDWRFTWPQIPFIEFFPATGHLHACSTKNVVVVFNPNELVEYLDVEVRMPMYNILYLEQRPLSQWESPMVDTRMLELDQSLMAKVEGKIKVKNVDEQKIIETKETKEEGSIKTKEKVRKAKLGKQEGLKIEPPLDIAKFNFPAEPSHTMVPQTNNAIVMKLHAIADTIRYECEAKSIHFKSTMMFQTRSFSFNFKNLSKANLDFHWIMYLQNGEKDHTNLYKIYPESGSLTSESSTTIVVKFSPFEVEDCTRVMKCDIPQLDPQWMPLRLPITGHVTRPWCHFKLPKSDYIIGKKRGQFLVGPDGELGPLDQEIKVIEITSLGINVQNFITFITLNPTSQVYRFEWSPIIPPSQAWQEDETPLQSNLEKLEVPFRCLSKVGEINPGEGYEMNFEFIPVSSKLQERFWTFKIPSLDISVLFLLVGSVVKPKLHFDHAVVNFGKVQVGTREKSCIKLINLEDVAFPFSFDKSTYLRTQYQQNPLDPVLLFLPQHGTIDANSEVPITIKFIPIGEGPQNFNVVCNLKKSLQLTINVKGEGYTIHDKVFLEVLNDDIPLQLSSKHASHIDFGEIIVNNMVFKRFQLTNTGIFPFQFVWMLGGQKDVIVQPLGGTLGSQEKTFCNLSFCPKSPGVIMGATITCQICHSNSYVLNLSAIVYRPKAIFSFLSYDFGPTFLDAPERDPPIVELVVKNAGLSSIMCENLYERNPNLDVPQGTLLIPTGEQESLFITFKPQEIKAYKEHVKFSINGVDIVTVLITGEGVGLDIQLKDPSQKHIIFDSLKIGQFSKIPVHLLNKSIAPCQISWAPLKARFLELDMVCLPTDGLLLKGNATGIVEIQFRPKSRIAPFNEPFLIAVANTKIVLATISGVCTGTEVKLSANKLAFGTITLGSKLTRKIQVENCGDIGAAFAWDFCSKASECTFFPPEGYLAPHQLATVEVSFHPTIVHPDILIDRIHCVITGGETQFLSIIGACIEHDPPIEILSFVAPVRSTDTKSLQIKNTTDKLWMLTPKIENNYFEAPCIVEVPSKCTVGYNITFHPLTMSSGKPHMGSITLPIPDGSTLFYKLVGDAGSPLPAGDITYDVMARREENILLQVENWLKVSQVFKLIINQHLEDMTTTLTGPKAIEVHGGETRECLLNFHAYRQGTYGSKVTFLNEHTREYIFYNLMVVANKGDIVKVIPFECVLRQRVVHTLHIKNPIDVLLTFTIKCDNPEVRVPTTLDVDPTSLATIDIAYRPLLQVQMTSYLTLTNQILGEMVYQLNLTCHAGGFDDTLTFIVPLGCRETKVFRFIHYLPTKVSYKCEMSEEGMEAGFIVPPTASADAADLDGREVEVSIIFEPSVVGENKYGVLHVNDPKGGKYSCRLLGSCIAPVPQGPIILRGKGGSINFRNVFDTTIQFVYMVDNPTFQCGKGEKIGPKKQTKVLVSYKPTLGYSDRGRLTISSPNIPAYRWLFYLQGSTEPEVQASSKGGKSKTSPPPSRGKAKK